MPNKSAPQIKLSFQEKVAPRNQEIRARYAAGKTQKSIAVNVGPGDRQVRNILKAGQKSHGASRTVYQLQSGTNPETAAGKIIDKFGDEYAANLSAALTLQLMAK